MYKKQHYIFKAFLIGISSCVFLSCTDKKAAEQTTIADATTNEIEGAETTSNSKILFSSSRDGNSEIYIMNMDGSNQKRITNNEFYDGDATWSPDGTKIAFVSDRDGDPEIYIMNADGTNVKRITNSPGEDNSPEWSPDGSMIAFNTGRFGNRSSEILRRNIEGWRNLGTEPDAVNLCGRYTFRKSK